MKQDAKTTFAQSSDIKARSYLEYRRDMKKKAIAELETFGWLDGKLKELHPGEEIVVEKSGGDRFLWFLRTGGVSQEADFSAHIGDKEVELEFQYAEKGNLKQYDFKISKVARKERGKEREPISNKFFIYIHFPAQSYAIIEPIWIMQNGVKGTVPAWGSREAYRVPSDVFMRILEKDPSLPDLIDIIYRKKAILDFQHEFMNFSKARFIRKTETMLETGGSIQISAGDLDSFFTTCFLMDSMNMFPEPPMDWLVRLISMAEKDLSLEDIAKMTYCLDFLYSKINPDDQSGGPMNDERLSSICTTIKTLMESVRKCEKSEGYYLYKDDDSKMESSRNALFAINLLEDMTQDIIHYYGEHECVKMLRPVQKIFENVRDVRAVSDLIIKSGATIPKWF